MWAVTSFRGAWVGALAAALALSTRARAEDHAQKRSFELRGLIGYEGAWTTGLDPYAWGVGFSGGVTIASPLFLGARLTHHFGRAVSAVGPGTLYRAHETSSSLDGAVAVSWRPTPWLIVRPGLVFGGDLISGTTTVGRTTVDDSRLIATLGPALHLLLRHQRFLVGVEGDARFVPSQPAAPRAALCFTWGTEL